MKRTLVSKNKSAVVLFFIRGLLYNNIKDTGEDK